MHTECTGMILAAEYIPSPTPLQLMLDTQELGFPIPPGGFPFFFGKRGFPVSRFAGIGKRAAPARSSLGVPTPRAVSRFGRERESGSGGSRTPGAAGGGFPGLRAASSPGAGNCESLEPPASGGSRVETPTPTPTPTPSRTLRGVCGATGGASERPLRGRVTKPPYCEPAAL